MGRWFRWAELVTSPSPVLLTLGLGIALGVVEFGLFMGLPFVVIIVLYVVWIVANYSLEIVEHRALGHDDWPVFSLETLVAGRSQAGIVYSMLVVALVAGWLWLRHFGPGGSAGFIGVAGAVLLPASIALMAVRREFSAAFDPARAFAAAVGMGIGYFVCLGGALGVLLIAGLAESRGGLWYFPLIYAVFLEAFLIGSVVYSRRAKLGVVAPRSPEAREARLRAATGAERENVLSRAYGFAAHGNKAGALKYVEAYLNNEEDSLEARLWMFDRMTLWESADMAIELGKRIIGYCEQNGLTGEADALRRKCEQLYRQPAQTPTSNGFRSG